MGLIYDARRAILAQNNLIMVDAEKECKRLNIARIE